MKVKYIALILMGICFSANAQNLIRINNEDYFDYYKTIKPTEVEYLILFFNFFEPSDDVEEDTPNKNGLYTYAMIDLGQSRPSDFPLTLPSVDPDKLIQTLKININDVNAKFKGVKKNQHYTCQLSGKMRSQFEISYLGGDNYRFPASQVRSKIISATPVGLPKIKCEKM